MKALLLILLSALFLTVGCRSPYYSETLIEIPSYPEPERAYDTSARIAVYATPGFSPTRLSALLTSAGYTVLDEKAPYQATFQRADKIVSLVAQTSRRLEYNEETYLYARIVVLMRGPFNHDDTEKLPTLTAGVRHFQAHARRNFGTREIVPADIQAVYDEAYANLLRNPAFREALERTPPQKTSEAPLSTP